MAQNSGDQTERPILKKLGSFKPRMLHSSSTISREDSDIDEHIHRYTSLKDLLSNSPSIHASLCEGNTFDSSTISIRNELVKHAASAYVQSAAALIANKDQDWLTALGEKIKSYVASPPRGHVYFTVSIRSCFRPIFRCLDYIVSRIRRSLS